MLNYFRWRHQTHLNIIYLYFYLRFTLRHRFSSIESRMGSGLHNTLECRKVSQDQCYPLNNLITNLNTPSLPWQQALTENSLHNHYVYNIALSLEVFRGVLMLNEMNNVHWLLNEMIKVHWLRIDYLYSTNLVGNKATYSITV